MKSRPQTSDALRRQIDDAIRSTSSAMGSTSYSRVHAQISRDIIVGRLKAGARLKATELAEKYGISPVPIREALQKLAGEGLIVMTPNRGAHVRGVDEDYILQLHEMRRLLASHRTASSIIHMTDAVIERLEIIQDLYEGYLRSHDVAVMAAANHLFHDTLDTFATNEVMAQAIKNHFEVMRILRVELGFSELRKVSMTEEHHWLIQAARDRDGAAAAKLVRQHIQNGCDDFIRQFRVMQVQVDATRKSPNDAARPEEERASEGSRV